MHQKCVNGDSQSQLKMSKFELRESKPNFTKHLSLLIKLIRQTLIPNLVKMCPHQPYG